MTTGKVNKRVIGDRFSWIERMVVEIKSLPLESYEAFTRDSRNIWSAESCLRRTLEALLDIGRHILAKCFGKGISEYKEISKELEQKEVLSSVDAQLLRIMAGYRNRLVHFYHEVSTEELYRICKENIDDVLKIKKAYLNWINDNPDRIDETL
jgi:uncharacterized protein YutE (UPF0331/DUF86 family)